eukprot:CAMPEP_0170079526 /NCGR_PEP_ID=MMETSP0019_2-20121128/15890_1 /TAXON_ID=98059 /ORGANISM="Dinobryon sp., Strain UTEXLB2267" /LENGTH=63 /DNA_ID=CAMNT_0010293037 /DNA_START=178 /DNA_END=366 /DNA_ORIENTATION=-
MVALVLMEHTSSIPPTRIRAAYPSSQQEQSVYKNEFPSDNYYMDLVNLIDGDEEVNEGDELEE